MTLYANIYSTILRSYKKGSSTHVQDDCWVPEAVPFDYSTHTPIHQLMAIIYDLPYVIRKFILDFTRIQNPISINSTLETARIKLLEDHRFIPLPKGLYPKLVACGMKKTRSDCADFNYICSLLDNIYDNPILCSLLSYVIRAERTRYPEQFIEAGRATINKELAATQLPNIPIQLDYRALFSDGEPFPVHMEKDFVPFRTIHLWRAHLSPITKRFSNSHHLIFPHFNAKKTISHPSQNRSTTSTRYPILV